MSMSDSHITYQRQADRAVNPHRERAGLHAVKIGSTLEYTKPARNVGRRGVVAESSQHLEVMPRSEFSDLAHTWHCRTIVTTPGKVAWMPCEHMAEHKDGFKTKSDLIRAHGSDSALKDNEETHLYYAVADEPAVAATPAVMKDGKEVRQAQPAQPAKVTLMSDEAFAL